MKKEIGLEEHEKVLEGMTLLKTKNCLIMFEKLVIESLKLVIDQI